MNRQTGAGGLHTTPDASGYSVAALRQRQMTPSRARMELLTRAEAGRSRRLAVLGCLILFLSFSVAGVAQIDISASLTGAVTDQNGAVVPGAIVMVHNVDTGVEAKTASNGIGSYQFASLSAGTYTVTCAVKGFKSFTATDVVLHVGGVTSLPVILQVGAASETVTVSGSSAMVDTETANNLTTIDPDLIEAIPVQGRDPRESMEMLMPGSTAAGTGASFFIPVTSFNGVSQFKQLRCGRRRHERLHAWFGAARFPQSENISEFSVASALSRRICAARRRWTGRSNAEKWDQSIPWPVLGVLAEWSMECELLVEQFPGCALGSRSTSNGTAAMWAGQSGFPNSTTGKDRTFFFLSFERTAPQRSRQPQGRPSPEDERGGDFTNSPDGVPVINGVPRRSFPHPTLARWEISSTHRRGRPSCLFPQAGPTPLHGIQAMCPDPDLDGEGR